MRKEIFGVGSYVHIIHRGVRGSALVKDDLDRLRFLKLLRYLNDENVPRNWEREIGRDHVESGYSRPGHWPKHQPYVSIMAYCLLDNHFHLLVREESESGVSRFMQRICTSMALHFNARHKERGSLFQGPYRASVVDTDEYLQYINAYIQVKNGFERQRAARDSFIEAFDDLYDRTANDPFVSLGEYLEKRPRSLIDLNQCRDILMSRSEFKKFASDVIAGRKHLNVTLE